MSNVVRKLGSMLIAALFAGIAIVPLVSAQSVSADSVVSRLSSDRLMVAAAPTPPANCQDVRPHDCPIIDDYINPLVNFLAALVGVAVVISIIIGGIQYSSSGGDPSKAAAAKNRIRNAVIALVAFILLWSILNFLIPGGLT
jgi:hypothetical protein